MAVEVPIEGHSVGGQRPATTASSSSSEPTTRPQPHQSVEEGRRECRRDPNLAILTIAIANSRYSSREVASERLRQRSVCVNAQECYAYKYTDLYVCGFITVLPDACAGIMLRKILILKFKYARRRTEVDVRNNAVVIRIWMDCCVLSRYGSI